jgi:protein-S-isoprenylcysteine O-methyltransferase Ste14
MGGEAMSGQDHTGAGPVNAPIFPRPPVVTLLFIAAGWALNHLMPLGPGGASLPLESAVIGGLIIACAVAIVFFALRGMIRARTTFRTGEKADALVYTGVYKRTRNPIYLSFTFFTLGLGIATANPWMVVLAPALLLYLQERVVKREEAYLKERFGAEYADYMRKVRRWL